MEDPNLSYGNLVNILKSIIDQHAPLKQKKLRGNEAPFMNKILRREIYTRSRLKNKLNKNPLEENKILYKNQRNKCVNLRKKAIKTYFKSITYSGIMENKNFWQTIKPFITNKSGLGNSHIMLLENNSLISDEKEHFVMVVFNKGINIIKHNFLKRIRNFGHFGTVLHAAGGSSSAHARNMPANMRDPKKL